MSSNRFFEGLFLGAALGVLGTLFLKDEWVLEPCNTTQSREKNTNEASAAAQSEDKEEVTVSKTLEAIEKGFSKISKMIDDKKQSKASIN